MDESRLNHSLAVARKMVEIGKEYNLNDSELQDLFVLGFNHDIGYEYGNNSNHAHIGGEILKRNNYKYWKEIYYHGKNQICNKGSNPKAEKQRSTHSHSGRCTCFPSKDRHRF